MMGVSQWVKKAREGKDMGGVISVIYLSVCFERAFHYVVQAGL
jgi:hypothetical protein